MSLTEYEDFVYSSCLVDRGNPVAEWKRIHEEQGRICDYLNNAIEIRIVGEDADLSMMVKGGK